MQPSFIHLRNHSAYSLSEGAIRVGELALLARQNHMPAVAITDTNNMFGALEFSLAAKEEGVQPILGIELLTAPDEAHLDQAAKLVLLAKDETGHAHLLKLASRAWLHPYEHSGAIVTLDDIAVHSAGLICLTGGTYGPIGIAARHGNKVQAESITLRLKDIFEDRLYMELNRHGREEDKRAEPVMLELTYSHDIPLVATNNCLFTKRDMFTAQDCLMCIAHGRYLQEVERPKYTPEHYFKTPSEMELLFKDLPEAIENTVVIAQRCAVMSHPHAPMLPDFPTQEGRTQEEEFEHVSREGLKERLEQVRIVKQKEREQDNDAPAAVQLAEADWQQPYWERLEYEMGIIKNMQFPGYFLIVSDFIRWAKEQDIPVGPGRGSGAGSVVAWAMKITDLDPLKYGLLFERFLNPERVSMPDFDVDFCQWRRDEVINYVQQKYGADQVAQIITFGKLQARAVVRDVGRVLQMPYGQVDRICKMIPNNPAKPVTLSEAIKLDPELSKAKRDDQEVGQLLDLGLKLEGMFRHAGTHAAGVVIGSKPLDELIPLYKDPRSSIPATQFSMKYAEMAGLVKFDFLGLKTLTLIQQAVELVNHNNSPLAGESESIDSGGGVKGLETVPPPNRAELRSSTPPQGGSYLNINLIPINDKKTFEMLSRGDSTGVFQMESAGMRDALRKMKPDSIEDIIALISLYRPGPMENIPTYIARKHGREKPDYLHPKLQPCLEETYGVIIYQEQVMEIAKVLAGYSLGDADLLRRAMGKKIASEMDKQRERFMQGAEANKVDPKKAGEIFDLVAKFAGYGFNKSHAAAYALIGYQTAYLKANYPVEFLTACMNIDMGDTDKLALFVAEARRTGIEVLPPDVNKSDERFTVEESANMRIRENENSKENEHSNATSLVGEAVRLIENDRSHFQDQSTFTKAIRYGLGGLKGVGSAAMQQMVKQRKAAGGHFKDIYHFAESCDNQVVNKRQVEGLAKAGAFDTLFANRAQLVEGATILGRYSQTIAEEKAANQNSLFGDDTLADIPKVALPQVEPWDRLTKLKMEREVIGFYLKEHPLDAYAEELEAMHFLKAGRLMEDVKDGSNSVRLVGMPTALNIRSSKRGRYAFLHLSDPSGAAEINIFDETLLLEKRDVMEGEQPIVVACEARKDEGGVRLLAEEITLLDEVLANRIQKLTLSLNRETDIAALQHIFAGQPKGRAEIVLDVPTQDGHHVKIMLGERYQVRPELSRGLEEMAGVRVTAG